MRLALSADEADVELCMATFSQWNRKRAIRQVTWVCGPESALAREVLTEFRQLLVPTHSYFMDIVTREADMWDSILTWPRGPSLAVVYGAERIKHPERICTVVETVPELAHVLFISYENDFTKVPVLLGGKATDEKPQLAPHLAAIRDSKHGQLVRCCRPSSEEELLKLVASWWPGAGANLASALLARTMGELDSAYMACKIAGAAGLPPSVDYLDMACQGAPVTQYAEHLLGGHRREAMTEARQLSEAAVGGTLKFLSGQLSVLRRYHAMVGAGMDADQIARKGIPRWQQKAVAPVASSYSADRVVRCHKVLAVVEEAFRSGVRDGLLEALATLW